VFAFIPESCSRRSPERSDLDILLTSR
jgi:hypothetical protein